MLNREAWRSRTVSASDMDVGFHTIHRQHLTPVFDRALTRAAIESLTVGITYTLRNYSRQLSTTANTAWRILFVPISTPSRHRY